MINAPLVTRCSNLLDEERSDGSPTEEHFEDVPHGHDWHLHCCACGTLPGAPRNPALGVAHALANPIAKWAFVATNLGYFVSAALVLTGDPLPDGNFAFSTVLCDSPAFFGTILLVMAFVSTYWHGAQCQLQMPRGCRWLYAHGHLQSLSWLKCLVVADVSCAALTVVVGMSCFGPARLWSWLAIPFLVFLLARDAKAKKQYIKYVYLHGLWHLLSALATWAIVLDGGLPFGW